MLSNILIVRGAYNTGKTKLLNILAKKLIDAGGKVKKIYPENHSFELPKHRDFSLLLEYKGKKIFIVSCGDSPDKGIKYLDICINKDNIEITTINEERFNKHEVDIIIGASRTRGKTVEEWEKLEKAFGITIKWFQNNERKTTEEEIEKYSKKQLEKLFDILKELV